MDPDRTHALLTRERERIEQALAGIEHGHGGAASGGNEPGDDGSDLREQEFDAGLAEHLAEQLAAVERAEARLAAGTYGLSIESGERIPDERLEALPTAERTLKEQERSER